MKITQAVYVARGAKDEGGFAHCPLIKCGYWGRLENRGMALDALIDHLRFGH